MRRLSFKLTSALTLCLSVLLSGCQDLTQAPKDAEQLNTELHAAMTRGDLKNIYADADAELKALATEEKIVGLLAAIHKKLGDPVSSKQAGCNLNATTSGTYLRTECDTTFSKSATGKEAIVWRKAGGKYRLAGYHINSDELISR